MTSWGWALGLPSQAGKVPGADLAACRGQRAGLGVKLERLKSEFCSVILGKLHNLREHQFPAWK